MEYLDLYLMHWPLAFRAGRGGTGQIEAGVTLLDTWRAMEVSRVRLYALEVVSMLTTMGADGIALHHQALVDTGKVRHIGVSNFTQAHLQQILPHCRVRPVVNQVELHPYLPQSELAAFCAGEGIPVRLCGRRGGRGGGTAATWQRAYCPNAVAPPPRGLITHSHLHHGYARAFATFPGYGVLVAWIWRHARPA